MGHDSSQVIQRVECPVSYNCAIHLLLLLPLAEQLGKSDPAFRSHQKRTVWKRLSSSERQAQLFLGEMVSAVREQRSADQPTPELPF